MSNLARAFAAAFQDHQAGRIDEAEAKCRQILSAAPDSADAWHLLGLIARDRNNLPAAAECVKRSLQSNPNNPAAWNNLGILLKNQGNLAEAVDCYSQVVRLDPGSIHAYNNLANVWHEQGKLDEAESCCRRAIQLNARFVDAHVTFGNVLKDQGRLDDAAAAYRHALALNPNQAAAHSNLGNVLKDQGDLDGALACFRRAMELKPERAAYHSNYLYTLLFHPGFDERTIYDEHVRWDQRHAARFSAAVAEHLNDRSPERRLRVGYVSPDFRSHSVGRFVTPLLEAHDRLAVEVICYSSVRHPDEFTARCQAAADVWRNVLGISDDQVAERIRQDQIDILVDLTMHMSDNRLLVFARKPAPVQVTYLAYCGTTGLSTMDYRLTDPRLDPPDRDESCYSERSIRLPETYWCYRPMAEAPAVGPVPSGRSGSVTFGSLNNFCKVNLPTLEAWGRLLRALPSSRLILHSRTGSHRERVRGILSRHGVSTERLIFCDWQNAATYFRQYSEIDVGLDPFPYGGGTTTCDALWMGVPVVSLAGPTAVSRGGLSLLSNLGLAELVATDVDQYLAIAARLAGDPARLAELRGTLRPRMQSSALMDEPRFARHVEAAYREMWRRWCAKTDRRSAPETDRGPAGGGS